MFPLREGGEGGGCHKFDYERITIFSSRRALVYDISFFYLHSANKSQHKLFLLYRVHHIRYCCFNIPLIVDSFVNELKFEGTVELSIHKDEIWLRSFVFSRLRQGNRNTIWIVPQMVLFSTNVFSFILCLSEVEIIWTIRPPLELRKKLIKWLIKRGNEIWNKFSFLATRAPSIWIKSTVTGISLKKSRQTLS